MADGFFDKAGKWIADSTGKAADVVTNAAQGGLGRFSASEQFVSILTSFGAGAKAINYLAGMIATIAEFFGATEFAEKVRQTSARTAARQSVMDKDAVAQKEVLSETYGPNIGPRDPSGTATLATSVAGTGVVLGTTAGGLWAGKKALNALFSKTVENTENPGFKASGSTFKTTLKEGLFGKTKLGKFLRAGAVAAAGYAYMSGDADAKTTVSNPRAEFTDAVTDLVPGVDIAKDLAKGDYDSALENTGGLAGGVLGAAFAGAVAGSVVPGLGTAAGFVVGGGASLVGYLAGDTIGRGITSYFNAKATDTAPTNAPALRQPIISAMNYAPAGGYQ